MRYFLKVSVMIASVGLLCLIGFGVWTVNQLNTPAAFETEKEFIIQNGDTGLDVANHLGAQNLISEPKIFYCLLRLRPITIKTGEYNIPPHASMKDIFNLLKEGKVVQRQFTLAEGLTVKQMMILLQQNEFLTGEVKTPPKEGSLMPDTYSFTRGETRDVLIARMQEAQKTLLDELWAKRDTSLPLKSPEEAVTLASIVEKETGKAEERNKIAGLFYNRLKIGMALQTDPTVVYAVTNGLGHMGGKRLYSKHLQVDSPYNTYKVVGLPPGPIANPGRASLEAVFAPEQHNYLFFVADGTGGHVFSETLAGTQRKCHRMA
jgi:UPF0755 protein